MRLLLLALAAALVLASAAAAACPSAADLEDELICPTCKTTLDQSDAPVARRMKARIARRAADCVPKEKIKDEFVAHFRPGVLAAPPREGFHWLAWILHPAGLFGGGGGWNGGRARHPVPDRLPRRLRRARHRGRRSGCAARPQPAFGPRGLRV